MLDAFRKKYSNPVMETLAKSFDVATFNDLKIKLKRKDTPEFEYIYGHKSQRVQIIFKECLPRSGPKMELM